MIPPYADARATLRTLDDGDRLTLREAARTLIEATCRAHDCPVEITIEPGEPLLANDPEITRRVRAFLPRAGLRAGRALALVRLGRLQLLQRERAAADGVRRARGRAGFHERPLHHPEFLPPEAAVSAVARTLALSYLGASAG